MRTDDKLRTGVDIAEPYQAVYASRPGVQASHTWWRRRGGTTLLGQQCVRPAAGLYLLP